MALVTTPGSATADSYGTVEEADTYHDLYNPNSEWQDMELSDKEARMRRATMLLDSMPSAWTGSAASATQSLGFPRVGMKNRNGFSIPSDVVPANLKYAEFEFALRLEQDDTRIDDDDVSNQGIKKVHAGPVEVEFSEKKDASGNIVRANATANLAGDKMVPDLVKVMLVPSWLKPTAAQEDKSSNSLLIFESI